MQEMQVWSLVREDTLEKGMTTHTVFLPGDFHGQRSLVGYSPWGHKESDTTKWLNTLANNEWEASGKRKLFLNAQKEKREKAKIRESPSGWLMWPAPGFLVIVLYFSASCSSRLLCLLWFSLLILTVLSFCLGFPEVHCYLFHFSVLIAGEMTPPRPRACSCISSSCSYTILGDKTSECAPSHQVHWEPDVICNRKVYT